MGRRSKYDPDTTPTQAYEYARDGMLNEEIAKKLGIAVQTLYDWIKRYPELDDAIKDGKRPVDIEVEQALLRSAVGYEVDYVEEELDAANKVIKSKRGATHVKPNPTSLIFWLKNRRPDKWRDKQDIEHSGEIKIEIDADDHDV